MPVKPVQISVETELLERIDADEESRTLGRSAFIRKAITLYLQAKKRRATDRALRAAYRGQADAAMSEIEDLIAAQAWPDE